MSRAGLAGAVVLALTATGTAPAFAAEPRTREGKPLTSTTTLTAGTGVQGAKSSSGRLAKSDPALLRATSAAPAAVVVKLDYDALAAYTGGVEGYPATSPSATGKALDARSDAAERYASYTEGVEKRFVAALRARFPKAEVGRSLRTVYGGLAVELPAKDAKALLGLPGVAAVQADTLNQRLTDSSGTFIGAPTVYSALGSSTTAGKGVVVGVLDSGAWPEHPSYADPGGLPAPPPTKDGTARVCDFGDNPLTPATDVFPCTNKLISGQPFLDTYNAVVGGDVYPDSARDSNGHGTHTSTTAAGSPVADAGPLGVSRGPVKGIAPGAAVAVYKVCGADGCYSSDSAAAVQRAILDGVRVINFSISGGSDPYADVVELAFLDAYAAGVFVAASAGNSGPGAATADHASPWVTTVAASTQTRAFESTLTLSSTDGSSTTLTGASITGGVAAATPVVAASAAPYNDATCSSPATPGLFAGKVVVCRRGGATGRVQKGFNVRQGGAAGMILHNTTETDTETDNHWLPTVHLASGTALLAYLDAHPGVTARFTAGAKTTAKGDVVASFSSRGPLGDWLKPDVTAPGVQILAGHTPTPESVVEGPPGNLYQAIAGTSMSSPHVAGAAALLFALHPDWTPGQVKSALQTTAKRSVVKEDGTTPADPHDVGSGRIDLTVAGNPGITFDETAATYVGLAADPAGRPDANLPSVNVGTMPGAVTVDRVAKNVSGKKLRYTVRTTAPSGVTIAVVPSSFEIAAGATKRLTIAIAAPGAANGQYFGRIELNESGKKLDAQLPVAFVKKQGSVTATQACTPPAIARQAVSTCTVSVQNTNLAPATVTAATHLDSRLQVASVTGATRITSQDVAARATLAARQPDRPTVAEGDSVAGYVPLDAFGGTLTLPLGDEQAENVNVPAFRFAGSTYTSIGVTSNGYAVAGGTNGSQDITLEPQTLPDPARPNAVLAPYWTDLDGTGAPGALLNVLTDGVNDWVVVEWRVNLFGTADQKRFQLWLGTGAAEDISYAYDGAVVAPPAGYGLTIGAENAEGTAGSQLAGVPAGDVRVTSTPGVPGGTLTYTVGAKGVRAGTGTVTTGVVTPAVRGVTTLVDRVTVQ